MYKLHRLNIPKISILTFDGKQRMFLWECYEITSGIYILVVLFSFLTWGIWVDKPNTHWIILIIPVVGRNIYKYFKSIGFIRKEYIPHA